MLMFNLFDWLGINKKVEDNSNDEDEYTDGEAQALLSTFTKKENRLLPSLKIVVNSLEKDIVHYDWHQQQSCNCGLVVQAVLNATPNEVQMLFDYGKKYSYTTNWQEAVKDNCSITGIPMNDVFKTLYDLGLRPEDIVHLEYLNNRAILEIAKIDIKIASYYSNKENLILYLKAWVKILEHRTSTHQFSNKGKLEADLLVAINNEEYGLAHKIKNEIIMLD